jgi:cytochrome c-type biogenesis protein
MMNLQDLLTSFSLGLLASGSPCVLPLYPGYLAYLSAGVGEGRKSGIRYLLGGFVLLGVLAMMLALGAAIAALSVSVGRALSWIIPLADLALIALGLLLIFDYNPFQKLPQVQAPTLSHPFSNAFLYGLLYGPIAMPCSGPFLVSIFALSLTPAEFAGRISLFLSFGLGFGLPLLLISFLSAAAQRSITRLFARHARRINLIGGFLLIGLGLFDLIQNWDLLRTYLPLP